MEGIIYVTMRNAVLVLIYFSFLVKLPAQEPSFTEEYKAKIDSILATPSPITGFRQELAPMLAKRLREGPVDRALANAYHQVSRNFKKFAPIAIKPYADTTILLRIQLGFSKKDLGFSYYQKGLVLRSSGDYSSALVSFQQGIKMMRDAIAGDSTSSLNSHLAYFHNEAAIAAKGNGNYPLAELLLKQVPILLQNRDRERTRFTAALILADTHKKQGLFPKAIAEYQALLASPYYGKTDANNQAVVHQNLSIAYNESGDFVAAERHSRQALNIFQQGEIAPRNYAAAASNLMLSLLEQGRYAETEEVLQKGLAVIGPIYPNGKSQVIGELYARAATTAALQNNFFRADSFLRLSAEALFEATRFRGPANLPTLERATMYGQEDVLEMLTVRRDVFIRAYEQNVAPKGLELALATSHSIDTLLRLNRDQLNLTASLGQFINLEAEQYTKAIDLALRLFRATDEQRFLNEAYQFAANQKSNLLRRYLTSEGLATSLGVPEEVVAEKANLELMVLTAEEALRNASPAARAGLRDSLLQLNTEVDRLKRNLATAYPAFSRALRGLTAINPEQAAAKMKRNQLLVEYFLSNDSIYLFTLRNGEGLSVVTQARPGNLGQVIGEVIRQGEGARRLYNLLVAPVLASRPNVTRLQFIPDGELWSLPFGALLTPSGDFLIEKKAVSLAYAAPLLFELGEKKVTGSSYQGYGISYRDLTAALAREAKSDPLVAELADLEELPFAGREVEEAYNILGGNYLLDETATKSSFIEKAATANILHLSMHGLLRFTNPLESALVFRGEDQYADLLTMREVLSGQYPAELTVLSACHTGGGPLQTSEGIQTIGRAFTAAGSRATITSAWAARDEVTYNILRRFFAKLKAGRPKDLALQDAIKTYLKEGTKANRQPEYWANLALTGIVAPIEKRIPWLPIMVGLVLVLGGGALVFGGRNKNNKAG